MPAPTFGLDARARGSLLHGALEEFWRGRGLADSLLTQKDEPRKTVNVHSGFPPGKEFKGANDGRTLFAVGDPMQSSYRFRKADVGLFLRVRQRGIVHAHDAVVMAGGVPRVVIGLDAAG